MLKDKSKIVDFFDKLEEWSTIFLTKSLDLLGFVISILLAFAIGLFAIVWWIFAEIKLKFKELSKAGKELDDV